MDKQRKEGTEINVPTPWYDQYNTHAHKHITRAVQLRTAVSAFSGLISMKYPAQSQLRSQILSFTAEADAQAPQLHTTHVVAVGCKYGSLGNSSRCILSCSMSVSKFYPLPSIRKIVL